MAHLITIDSLKYGEYLTLKEKLYRARVADLIENTWLFTSHNPGVFTKGRSSTSESIIVTEEQIRSTGRDIYEIERGGDVTYHGPSQVMIYPFIDVPDHDIQKLVRKLEKVVMEFLNGFSLRGEPRPGFPGIWCNSSKIASIGLAVRKWVTMHGMSFNHEPDDGGFDMIIPCGIKGITMTSLEQQTGKKLARKHVLSELKISLESVFNIELSEIDFVGFKQKLDAARND
jgi:lipoic acid synthetase